MTNPSAARELATRTAWALARITELVNLGRSAGWLSGEPLDGGIASDAVLAASIVDDRTPMQELATRLALTTAELDTLWLLACIELDPHVAEAARLLIPGGMSEISAQLLERLITRGGTFEDDVLGRLDELALVTSDPRLPLHRRPVRVDEAVLQRARGSDALERRLRDLASIDPYREEPCVDPPPELHRIVEERTRCLVVATGAAGSGRAVMLASVASKRLRVRAAELASDAPALAQQLRAIARESRVHEAHVVLCDADDLASQAHLVERELLRRADGPVFATTREPRAWNIDRPVVTIAVAIPGAREREASWARALPTMSPVVRRDCAEKYTIAARTIASAARTASLVVPDAAAISVSDIHRALRPELEQRLVGIARRVEIRQTWSDLVLPVDQFDLLVELVARVRQRSRVLDDWGFADKVGRGLGVSALLSGPPGTGKTMIAGLVANELGLDLYQVDLSKIVSKYIGETEKQLASLFDAAECGHAILLFDEADSLFAKRTEVKSSNDRYANLEVNYLLQRIEAFCGITLLTTNHETAIDPAFMRRLALHVRVPMPDEAQREALWRAMFPDRAERADDLDFVGLARTFVMSGGYIKNAVLRAAFLSAEDGSPITNEHLWRAARGEYESMGKLSFQHRVAS